MKKVLALVLAGIVTASASAGDVVVAAAASLADVMKAVAPLYAKAHPEVKLVFVHGATGMLRTQLLKGAPCDVFIGADRWFGGSASNASDVVATDSVRIVAVNTLVAATRKDFSPQGETLATWLGGARKIGIGNPASVPAGRYTKRLLEGEQLWAACGPKLVQATNVREVLLWLRQGAVDLGFVYGSDLAAVNGSGIKRLAEYEAPGGEAIELAGGVVKNARRPSEAQEFLDYLRTPEAAAVFQGLGFRVAE